MNFGEKLRQLRKQKGLTQAELGKLTNQTVANISRYELGVRQPSLDTVKEFANFFGVSVDYLLGVLEKDAKEELSEFKPTLTAKDEKDIAKDVENLRVKLKNKENGPALFNGEEISDDGAELFLNLFEVALRNIKIKNKETYTPKKYKK